MICTNCFEAEYKPAKTDMTVDIDGRKHILRDLDCEACPTCGEIIFSHQQSLEIDKKRIAFQFGEKPLLTPDQLKLLRRVLDMNLEEVCNLLHIGRNTYGRWERGEVAITPSMNLLIHNFIERFPDARVNFYVEDRIKTIEKANATLLGRDISLGEYLREVMAATRLLPDVVYHLTGIVPDDWKRIQNNEMEPEKIPSEMAGKVAHFFRLTLDALEKLLNETWRITSMKSSFTAIHARSCCHGVGGLALKESSMNKIIEKVAQKRGNAPIPKTVSKEYLAKVKAILEEMEKAEG